MRHPRKLSIDRGEPLAATAQGRHCPKCGRSKTACECRPGAARGQSNASSAASAPPADGIVRVARQTKGRAGKGVTLVTGLSLAPDQLAALCKQLKQRCGAGGTAKDGVIEVQGDHREAVLAELLARGFVAKLAGG